MARVNVYSHTDEYDYEGTAIRVGHFDAAKADGWDDADHNGNGSGGTGRGQAVYRTAGGKWVLCHWSRWQDEADRFEYMSAEDAREWLLANREDRAVEKWFGDIAEEEDRRPGRPVIGEPVNVRLGDLLPQVDSYAETAGMTRAEAIRQLVAYGLAGYRERHGNETISEETRQ